MVVHGIVAQVFDTLTSDFRREFIAAIPTACLLLRFAGLLCRPTAYYFYQLRGSGKHLRVE
ncbi:hypothetical protein A0O30_18965 [Pseudomonas sp. LLC-1]|nr:hypothetical protein A0O30_18965 [Pseudomonas sp. LLC-1]